MRGFTSEEVGLISVWPTLLTLAGCNTATTTTHAQQGCYFVNIRSVTLKTARDTTEIRPRKDRGLKT